MVPVVGLEPTRGFSPTDFESVTSANSITPAAGVLYPAGFFIVKAFVGRPERAGSRAFPAGAEDLARGLPSGGGGSAFPPREAPPEKTKRRA